MDDPESWLRRERSGQHSHRSETLWRPDRVSSTLRAIDLQVPWFPTPQSCMSSYRLAWYMQAGPTRFGVLRRYLRVSAVWSAIRKLFRRALVAPAFRQPCSTTRDFQVGVVSFSRK